MKVKDLIVELGRLPQDLDVIMSKDPEGNGFGLLHDVCLGSWDPIEREAGIYELNKALKQKGYDKEDVKPIKCAILWP